MSFFIRAFYIHAKWLIMITSFVKDTLRGELLLSTFYKLGNCDSFVNREVVIRF